MPVSAAFQLSLDIFGLDRDSAASRQRIWSILAPRMDAIAAEYVLRLKTHTPFYRELASSRGEFLKSHISTFTAALFTRPFDEQWVTDTRRRVEEEMEMGLDLRNRCVISQVVLAELCQQLGGGRWLAANRTQLIEAAIRVLLLDITNAVALHYNAAVREAKAWSTQLDGDIQSFGEAVGGIRKTVGSVVTSLAESSGQLTRLAGATAGQADTAAAAANSTASNADQMASAVDGMRASISHIHDQAATSATMAHDALANADRANESIRLLSESVGRIGSVVEMIASIASQTNLLALNATIEAARAGEAGRGFAVVAAEVKSLATQTAKSTQEISDQIASVRQATLHSVEEIAGTGKMVGGIAEAAELVAAAVNEQSAVTEDISRGATHAVANATTAADALKTVAEMIRRTQQLATSVLESSNQLSELTREIDTRMDGLFDAASKQRGVRKIADLKKTASTDRA